MGFTGILGSVLAQPGNIELGSLDQGGQLDRVTVVDTVSSDVFQGKWKRLVDAIVVSPSVAHHRDLPVSVDDAATTAQSITLLSSVARVTQYAVEVIYKKSPSASVRHTVSTDSFFFIPGRQVPLLVAHSVHVAQAEAIGPTLHKLVVDNVHTSQVAGSRNTNVRIGVTTTIHCSVPTEDRDDHDRQSLTQSVHVAQAVLTRTSQVVGHVADAAAVRSVVFATTNPLRISMRDVVGVLDAFGGGRGDREILIIDEVTTATVANPKRPTQALRDFISVNHKDAGGGGSRVEVLVDAVHVNPILAGRGTSSRQSVASTIRVATTRAGRGPALPISVADAVHAATRQIPVGPKRTTVADAVALADLSAPRLSIVRNAVADEVTVAEKIHQNINWLRLVDVVTTKPRLATFDLDVTSRLRVTSKLRRDWDATASDTLPISQSVATAMRRDRSFIDTPPISQSVGRSVTWIRSVTDVLTFPENSFPERTASGIISVPIAYGGLVTNYTVLQSTAGAITLPAPLLGDGKDNVDAVTVHRSMNAKSLTFKNSSTRQRLRYTFRLDGTKALELRLFLEASLSLPITMTTFDAQVWVVQIPKAPVEIQSAGRSALGTGGLAEFSTIEVEMEGQKVSG